MRRVAGGGGTAVSRKHDTVISNSSSPVVSAAGKAEPLEPREISVKLNGNCETAGGAAKCEELLPLGKRVVWCLNRLQGGGAPTHISYCSLLELSAIIK